MIRATAKLKLKHDVRKQFEQVLKRAAGSSVSVGVHADAGSYQVKGASEPVVPAQTAIWNEFGTKRGMPPRPFLGPAIDQNQDLIQKTQVDCLRALLFKGWSVEKALSKLGLLVQVLIQNKIRENPGPPLSDAYAAHKKVIGQQQRTLIATGLMLRSVRFKVDLGAAAKREAEQRPAAATTSSPSKRSKVHRDETPEQRAERYLHEGRDEAGRFLSREARAARARQEGRDQGAAFKARAREQRAANAEKFAAHKASVRAAKAKAAGAHHPSPRGGKR